jgi:hypothetical protein
MPKGYESVAIGFRIVFMGLVMKIGYLCRSEGWKSEVYP